MVRLLLLFALSALNVAEDDNGYYYDDDSPPRPSLRPTPHSTQPASQPTLRRWRRPKRRLSARSGEAFCEGSGFTQTECESYDLPECACQWDDGKCWYKDGTCSGDDTPINDDIYCVNDDSTTDGYGDTCSSYYDSFPGGCGSGDDEDFTASEQYCACGGGEGTFAPTVTPAPTVDPSPRPTFAPTVTAAPTTTCLADSFNGTTLDAQWMYPAGGDGECLLSGNGTLICRNTIDGAHIRTARSFDAPLKISGSFNEISSCYYIKVSAQSSDSSNPFQNREGVVNIIWGCGGRGIFGQSTTVATTSCPDDTYDSIEITIDDSTVTFRDTAGTCDDLSLTEDIGASGPLYVYVGAETKYGDGDAIWNSVEICLIPHPTTVPTLSHNPTAVPSSRPTFAPRTSGRQVSHNLSGGRKT